MSPESALEFCVPIKLYIPAYEYLLVDVDIAPVCRETPYSADLCTSIFLTKILFKRVPLSIFLTLPPRLPPVALHTLKT